jgi:hypothetical protein
MMRFVFKAAAVFALATGSGVADAACNAMPGSGEFASLKSVVKLAVASSAAVFNGIVTAIEYIPAQDHAESGLESQVVRVAAHSWWKGGESRDVTLYTANHRNAAGDIGFEAHEYPYEVGKSYLIYAYESRGHLFANICTRTRTIGKANDEILVLDALKAEGGWSQP